MFFEHYKGKYYQCIGSVHNVHTETRMAVYLPLYECTPRFFVRAQEEFFGTVTINGIQYKRFKPIPEEELPQHAIPYISNIRLE